MSCVYSNEGYREKTHTSKCFEATFKVQHRNPVLMKKFMCFSFDSRIPSLPVEDSRSEEDPLPYESHNAGRTMQVIDMNCSYITNGK